jgi:hypothetical protein
MKNKAHTALQMIAAGHPVETVMDIVGLEPDELLEILNEVLPDELLETLNEVLGLEPELEPKKVHIVECVLETIESEILGEFDLNVN